MAYVNRIWIKLFIIENSPTVFIAKDSITEFSYRQAQKNRLP